MLVATFRIQQKQWNWQRLSNFSSQWRFRDVYIQRGYHTSRISKSGSTYINPGAPGVAEKARNAASIIRTAVKAKDNPRAIETTYSTLDYTGKMRRSSNPNRRFPSRLVAHSLVHALLREGQVMEAAYEMRKTMSLGITFHHRTMQTSISLLCSMPFTAKIDQMTGSNKLENQVYPGDTESGFLLSALHSRLPPPTRLAASLLVTGRRYRQKRTEEMFDRLINACLLQGEIVIAALLFVLLVKDWQVRSVLRASGTKVEAVVHDSEIQERHSELGFPTPLFAKTIALHRLHIPYPELTILQKILQSIKHHLVFTNTPTDAHLDSVESLALLANLVEEGSLPYGNISSLLRAIQDCPREAMHYPITIRHNDCVQTLPIYRYLHDVLADLCDNLPSQSPKQANLSDPRMLPCLDLRSYNTLLHYALRHRFSPSMANQILEHMVVQRKPPLKPDIVTYNILLRSVSLLRRNDIAYSVLEKLREDLGDSDDHSSHIPELRSMEKRPGRNIPKRIAAEKLSVPSLENAASTVADNYTLSSYITHLVSTSQLDLMTEILLELFPILVDSPRLWQTDSLVFQQSVERAVLFGPYVLAALLNGCQKSGKSGLTEKLWLLSREAELASWKPPANSQTYAPWCLSVEAYTSVMQCYANETKKGLNAIRGSQHFSLSSESYYNEIARMNKARHVVKGWAWSIIQSQGEKAPTNLRHEASKIMAWYLCNSMINVALNVSTQCGILKEDIPAEWRAQLEGLQWPIPDARFFNALLNVFGRRCGMQYRRRASSKRSRWNRILRVALEKHWRGEPATTTYDPRLVEIASILANYGYALPLAFRRVLIGRQPVIVHQDIIRKREITPEASPPLRVTFNPFALPVIKTRGLTFPQRCKLSRRRRGRCKN